ncbi:MAG TPA: condensation domain-containing protein, partial [Thermoanaerobaculia bacterium]
MAVAAGARSAVPTAAAPPDSPLHPFLDRRLGAENDSGRAVYETLFSPARHWVLAEHRVLGTPTVPGTTWLEMARAAFARESGARQIEIRDVVFTVPLMVVDGDARQVRTTLLPAGGETAFRIESRTAAGADWQEHAHGWLRRLEDASPARYDPAAVAARCGEREVDSQGDISTVAAGVVSWGPRWQSFRRARLGSGETLVTLELPAEHAGDLDGLGLHPALLDMATAAGSALTGGGSMLPQSYGRIRILEPLPGRFHAHVRSRAPEDGESPSFDVMLLGEDGRVLVDLERFTMKRLAGGAFAAGGGKARTPAGIHLWIAPDEGVEAFRRALACGRFSHLAVSPTDLPASIAALRREAAQRATPEDTAPRFSRPDLGTDYAAPTTDLETALAGVWQTVLGLEQVGIHDNFFDLGGDSVVGIQLAAQAASRGIALTPEQLFEHQTIAALARALDRRDYGGAPAPLAVLEPDIAAGPAGAGRARGGAVLAPGLPRGRAVPGEPGPAAHPSQRTVLRHEIEDIYHLSPVQQGMLFEILYAPGARAYFDQFVLRFEDGLDIDLLEQAWRKIVEHHPVLRTAFFWEEVEEPVQVVHRRAELPFERLDWRDLDPAPREENLTGFLEEDRARGFALDHAPLMRLTAIRWSETGWRIVLSYHHLVLDGWSTSLVLREVTAAYEALARGAEPALEKRRPFRDYIAWLRQQDLGAAEAYWRRTLEGAEPTPIGIDRSPGRAIAPGDHHVEA